LFSVHSFGNEYAITPKAVRDIWNMRTWRKVTRPHWDSADRQMVNRNDSCHDLFICVTWVIDIRTWKKVSSPYWDSADREMVNGNYFFVFHALFICVTWVMNIRTGMSKACQMFEESMSHIWRHITHMKLSCHTCKEGMSNVWRKYVANMNGSCIMFDGGMPHTSICVVCLLHTCDMIPSYVWHAFCIIWHAFFSCVTRLLHVRDIPSSYVWHDCVWHDTLICVTHHVYVWQNSFMCDHVYVWHSSFMRVTPLLDLCNMFHERRSSEGSA